MTTARNLSGLTIVKTWFKLIIERMEKDMKNKSVIINAGGGGSPEQSQRVVFGRQLNENYSQTSARRGRPRSYAQARALAFNAKGEKPAEPVLCLDRGLSVKKCAFTMAEILLSLTIIGVVAAITLPSLTGNINERTWNTQRKALYARFSQAIALMPSLNGYGTFTVESSSGANDGVDTAAETFITSGLSKVLKINNICDSEHLEDCGIVDSYTNMEGSVNQFPHKLSELNSALTSPASVGGLDWSNSQNYIDTKLAAFETVNGESVAVAYNPYCYTDLQTQFDTPLGPLMCANFIYDLNGTKGPNTVGKDIGFISVLYPTDSIVVAPMPLTRDAKNGATIARSELGKECSAQDSESRVPNIEEAASMFYNKLLLSNNPSTAMYWSSSVISAQYGWAYNLDIGYKLPREHTQARALRCVKR